MNSLLCFWVNLISANTRKNETNAPNDATSNELRAIFSKQIISLLGAHELHRTLTDCVCVSMIILLHTFSSHVQTETYIDMLPTRTHHVRFRNETMQRNGTFFSWCYLFTVQSISVSQFLGDGNGFPKHLFWPWLISAKFVEFIAMRIRKK